VRIPWIRVHGGLIDKPVTGRVADALGVNVHEAIGLLVTLWSQVAANGINGKLDDVSDAQIERWARWSGERGAFAKWVKNSHIDESGRIHEWDEYMGKLEQQREKGRNRVREFRERNAASNDTVTPHVTVTDSVTGSVTSPITKGLRNESVRSHARETRRDETIREREEEASSSSEPTASITGEQAFLAMLRASRRDRWSAMFKAWRGGMDFPGGKAVTTDDLNVALRDWLVANQNETDPKPNHVRAFVQQAMRSRKNGDAKDEASEEDAARFGYAGTVYDAIVSEGLARPQPNEEYLAKLKRLEETGVVHSAAELRADLKLLGVQINDVANKRTRAEGVRLIADTLRTKRRAPNASPNGAHV
jgi:hypothetical protein